MYRTGLPEALRQWPRVQEPLGKENEPMKRSALLTIAAVLTAASVVSSVAFAVPGPTLPETWTQITPGPTDFMDRHLTPECSGGPVCTGTPPVCSRGDETFSFFVKGGSSNNLVVYFEGGGACWDPNTCLNFPTYTREIDVTTGSLNNAHGIFDLANPDNPFKDWNWVFIPYCTGDIHWGSNDFTYMGPTGPYLIHHRGFDNFLVVLKWITENVEGPHSIFVTGSSAGSYGSTLGYPYIQQAYPLSKASLLGDAGNGVVTEQFQTTYINAWNVRPNLPPFIPGFDRPLSEISIADIYQMIAGFYPHRKLAQYTTAFDFDQTFFYNVMINTNNPALWANFVPVWCDWHTRMLSFVNETASASPNYRYYVGPGVAHTILGTDRVYTETSAGVAFLDWLAALVGNQGGTNGHGGVPWENVQCVDCQDPLVCP